MAVTVNIDQHRTEGAIQQVMEDTILSMDNLPPSGDALSPISPNSRSPQDRRKKRRNRLSTRHRTLIDAVSPTSANRRGTGLDETIDALQGLHLINEITQPSIAIPHDRNPRRSYTSSLVNGDWINILARQ